MKSIRVALVGCGYISQAEHLPNLLNNPELKLVALVEPRAEIRERASAILGLPVYASMTECLDRTPCEAVLIAAPPEAHADLAVEAATAKKHILLEKPLATNPDDGRRIVDAARAAGVILLVGYMRRYEAESLRVLELLRERAVGEPVALISRFQLCYKPVYASPLAWPDTRQMRGEPARPRTLRHVLLEESVHHINLTRMLLGEPNEILTVAGRPEAYEVVWRAGGAVVTHLNLSPLEQGEQVDLYGTDGHISWRPWSPHFPYAFADLRIFTKSRAEELRPVFPHVNPYVSLLKHFADCVRGDDEPRTTAEDAARDLEFIERILETAMREHAEYVR